MKALMVALILGLAVAGCTTAGGEAMSKSPPTPAASPTRTPAAATTAQSQQPSCPNGSLEGCYTFARMGDYLNAIKPMVAQFYESQYPKLPAPRSIVFVPRGQLKQSYCGAPSDSYAYEYCPGNRSIYIGQDLLWSFYRGEGDAAPVVALAHEWGHHVQSLTGVPFAQTAAQSVKFENQADCLAGAFAKFADTKGWLESGDLGDVQGLMQVVGSRESRYRDHGTVAERTESFQIGFKTGAKGCNVFFPSTPVA